MVLWGLIEITVTTVGTYNIIKGIYNIYRDAEKVKEKYKSHKTVTQEYLRTQGIQQINELTDSQYKRLEDDFLLIEDKESKMS